MTLGVAYMLFSTTVTTSIQARIADSYRGRVMSVYTSSLLLGVPIGALLQGKLAEVFDLRVVLAASGVLLLAYGAYAILRYDRLHVLNEWAESAGNVPVPARPAVAGADD